MAKEMDLVAKVGSWAFIIGVVVALLMGVFGKGDMSVVTTVLIVLGLIVGLLNVTGRETTPFLLASVSLVIVAYMGKDVFTDAAVFSVLKTTLNSIITFVMPATIIVALKAIYALAHDE